MLAYAPVTDQAVGAPPAVAAPILLSAPFVDDREAARAAEALRSRLAGNGPFTQAVEKRLSERLGGSRVLLTTSCTHALELALLALGIGPGQEVICPSFTFVSTANAILRVGARPVFADIEEDTLGLDAADVARRAGAAHRGPAARPLRGRGARHGRAHGPGADALAARRRGRRAGTRGDLPGPAPGHAGRRRLLQLPRDEERHLRRGRRPCRARPGPGGPRRDHAREGHEPQRVPPRRGGQVHLGGRGQQLRAVRRAGGRARRPARQVRRDPPAAPARLRALPRRALRLGARARRAAGSRPSGARDERPPVLPAASRRSRARPVPGRTCARPACRRRSTTYRSTRRRSG